MTDRTVIELRRIIRRGSEAHLYEMCNCGAAAPIVNSNDILMNVMRKDGRKFARAIPDREREPRGSTRPWVRVTTDAERRPKEIATVTLNARCVTRKIGHVRVAAGRGPIWRRIFMARAALEFLMIGCRVREPVLTALCDQLADPKSDDSYRAEERI